MKRIFVGALGVALVACGYKPSQELLTARNAYQTAAQGPAADVAPSDLHEARRYLERAESMDRDAQGDPATKAQAYIALRRAEWAQARAATATSKQQIAAADQRLHSDQDTIVSQARGQLADEKQRTAEAQRLATQADERTRQALDQLAQSEKVTREARGEVITLPNGVMFKTGKAELLPASHGRLDEVADALQKTQRTLIIEGHTDSRGGDSLNQRLSEKRAEAVKDYLVSRGVDESRVQVRGAGKSRPIADNSSAEGRALNRRVEIVLVRQRQGTAGAQPQQR